MLIPSARNITELGKPVTEPIFLLSIDFFIPVYLSSRGSVTWNGQTWQQAYFDILGIQHSDYGENTAIVRLDIAFRDTVLSEGVVDRDIVIWQLLGQPTFAVADGIGLFQGVGHRPRITRQFIDIEIAQTTSQTSQSPRAFYDHENMQPAGTKVVIGNTTITIDRAEFL